MDEPLQQPAHTSPGASECWPAIGLEPHPWRPQNDAGLSRSQLRKHRGNYQAAVVPHIANASLNLPGEVIADSAEASTELARFDGYLSGQLGEHVQGVGPLATILLRTESASSSQIENITVGSRQIAMAAINQYASANAKLVSANARATQRARELADDISIASILAMHTALLGPSDPHNAGQLRTQQVWIGGSGHGPHNALFVPPHHTHVNDALEDLIAFIDRDDIPALTKAAIAHAQFETIHPFTDGNGRTGRALVHAILDREGVVERTVLPISAGLLTDTAYYYESLTRYRAGEVSTIVTCFSQAAFLAARQGRVLVDEVSAIRDEHAAKLKARADAAAWRLCDLLIGQPVVNVAYVVEALNITKPTAQHAIDQLVEAEVLSQSTQQSRNRVWVAGSYVKVLDDFAASIRRR